MVKPYSSKRDGIYLQRKSQLVSIILPVRNEERYLANALHSVQEQTYPKELLEVIIVDGQSEDNTRQIAYRFQKKFTHFKLLDNPDRNTPAAINRAIKVSHGVIFILVSGHCELAPDYVELCVKNLIENDVECVGGVLTNVAETSVGRAIAAATGSPFGVGNAAFRTGVTKPALVDTVAFGAYRRSTVVSIGLFDESMIGSEDDEFNYRLRKNGGKILIVPEIRSKYYTRSNISMLWKQYFRYGKGKVKVLQKHPRQMRWRQFVPSAFVTNLFGSAILALVFPFGIIVFLLVGGSYLLANLLASLWITRRHGWRFLPFLPIIFAILHLSYGFGFLVGLVKYANRWIDRD